MTEKETVEMKELEEHFKEVSTRHGERAAALDALEKRLDEFPRRLADSSGKARDKVAGEFSKLQAEKTLLALEVGELEQRRADAEEAIFAERFQAAVAALDEFEQETLFPAKRAAEDAGNVLRAAINNRYDRDRELLSVEEIEKLRVAKAQAESALRIAAARRRDLRNVRDHRWNELGSYRRERDAGA